MALLRANRTAVVTLSTLLAGCAATQPMQKDATVFSQQGQTGVSTAQPATANAQPALDFDGALTQAQNQRKAGDFGGAARTLSQLVLIAPDDPRVLGEYGKTLVAQGRSDDAIAFLERALELQATDWTLYSAQGVAFDQKGAYGRAQESYARALALKPGEPTVLSNNALSHIQSGDLDGAERLLKEAAEAGGDYPRIASNLALVQSLKISRAPAAPPPAKIAIQPPPPPSSPAQAAVPPAPEAPPAPPVAAVSTPAESTPLAVTPEPSQTVAEETPGAEVTSLHPTIGSPTVRMQKVPFDPLAGPVAARKTPPAKPSLEASPPAPAIEARSDNPPAMLLRPSIDRAQQASAQQ